MNVLLLVSAPFVSFWLLLRALPAAGWRAFPKRLVLFTLIWVAQVVLNSLHIVGFAADAILFRHSKRVRVEKPIFILGIPRSGTTFLQRLLAADPDLTTLSTWECLLAPSVSERYFYQTLARMSKPLHRPVKRLQKKLFGVMDDIHSIELDAPEEDFLLLWSINACFLMFLLAPNSRYVWRLACFDDGIPSWWQNLILQYYHACLQKHLYYHGTQKRFLSKNPSFTAMMAGLRQRFPDARIIGCTRHPEEAIASQFSSLKPALRLLADASAKPAFTQPLLDTLAYYYQRLAEWGEAGECLVVAQPSLKTNLNRVAAAIYDHCGLTLSPSVAHYLAGQSAQSQQHQSRHRYGPESAPTGQQRLDRYLPYWARLESVQLGVS